MGERERASGESHGACALTNVCSVLAGEKRAQLQVCRNIKTQLRADMELVMQKSEGGGRRRRRRSRARGRRRRARKREGQECEIFRKQTEEHRDT